MLCRVESCVVASQRRQVVLFFSPQHLSPAPPKWLVEVQRDDYRMINGINDFLVISEVITGGLYSTQQCFPSAQSLPASRTLS